jgi:hypothetical protein
VLAQMQIVSLLSLEKHAGPYEKWPRLSRLYADGKDTGKKIPGYEIVGQYKCQDGYLLITSQDCPYEETNDFLLLNDEFDVVAKNCLGLVYSSFLINDHWPISNTAIRIHYHEDLFYTLAIEKSRNVFRRRVRLVIEKFEDFRSDAKAVESLASLHERMQSIRDSIENTVPPGS